MSFQTTCSVTAIMTCLFSMVSIVTITAIALDRYLSIIHCLRYTSWAPVKTTTSAIVTSWVIGIASSIPSVSGGWGSVTYDPQMYLCYVTWDARLSYAIFQLVMTYVVPIIIMLYSYLRIIAVARSHAKKITDLKPHVNRTSGGTTVPPNGIVAFAVVDPVRRLPVMGFPGASNKSIIDFELSSFTGNAHTSSSSGKRNCKQKAMLCLLGHILAFIICWTPFVVKEFKFLSQNESSVTFSSISFTITSWFLCLHSSWNPFIYAIMSGRFRKCALKLVRRKKTTVACVRDMNKSRIISTISHRRPHVTVMIDPARTKSLRSETSQLTISDHHIKSKLPLPQHDRTCPETNVSHHAGYLHKGNRIITNNNLPGVLEIVPSVESLESLDEGVFLDDETATKRDSK